jgi:hypothetical protein
MIPNPYLKLILLRYITRPHSLSNFLPRQRFCPGRCKYGFVAWSKKKLRYIKKIFCFAVMKMIAVIGMGGEGVF